MQAQRSSKACGRRFVSDRLRVSSKSKWKCFNLQSTSHITLPFTMHLVVLGRHVLSFPIYVCKKGLVLGQLSITIKTPDCSEVGRDGHEKTSGRMAIARPLFLLLLWQGHPKLVVPLSGILRWIHQVTMKHQGTTLRPFPQLYFNSIHFGCGSSGGSFS